MKKTVYALFAICLASATWYSCQREQAPDFTGGNYVPVLPEQPFNYNVQPTNQAIPAPIVDNHLATLGRVLFYDRALSVNNNMSCGSCHSQALAFSDAVDLSTGFTGQKTARNSMPIFNAVPNNQYFWDVRVSGLEEMVVMPVQHNVEMGFESLSNLVVKLKNIEYYRGLFNDAFPGNTDPANAMTEENVGKALATFVKSMVTGSSKFDQGSMNGFTNFTSQEIHGMQLFNSLHCVNCHGGVNFNNLAFMPNGQGSGNGGGWGGGGNTGGGNNAPNSVADVANIGLEMAYFDKGVTRERQAEMNPNIPTREGLFKVPSLRNVALTAPYMHDGRFATLFDVLNHYDHSIVNHPDLDDRLKKPEFDAVTGLPTGRMMPAKLNLSKDDKEAIVAFLTTLTDQTFISAERFSDPFRSK